jgi:hypothetical protein
MRQFTIAAAVAVGLVALWAAVLPLTTAPATKQAAATSPAMSAALFLCRGRNGPDHACVLALAKALMLDAKTGAPIQVSDRRCRADQQVLADLDRRD